ncbi:hydrogenase maturation nickel metallochaperone HypA [candidate division KSB1 bacterium]|nr:hydrogenase maturation nickel metallochaperone HypA [candidate division KSB1 bacterium]
MHELSLAREIVAIVDEIMLQHPEKSLKCVRVKVGELNPLIPDQLQSCYEALIADSKLVGSRLEIIRIPVRAQCRKCARDFRLEQFSFCCPHCESTGLDINSGDELMVSEVEF